MADNKRYYWLKLKRDFFHRHDIKVIESMPNGKDYILFYLKLLCESIDHDGNLRFSDEIPYNEQMLSAITDTNIDVVRGAITVFTNLHMMELLDDGTYYMNEVNKMLGSETKWAEKKRNYRLKSGQCPTNVLPMSDKSKSIEKELDKEIDKENKIKESELAPVDLNFDYESAWNSTFEIYPKKTNAVSARQTWISKLQEVVAENQKDVARLIYKATKAYLSDYEKNNPEDTKYRFIPKYAEWLKEDCDYWIRVIEQGERGNDS